MIPPPVPSRRKHRAAFDPRVILLAAVGLIAFAIALMLMWRDDAAPASSSTDTASHPPAPDFKLAGLEDSRFSLADFRGHYVLLNFWASWCPPCQAEMPELQEYYRDNRTRGFILLAVNVQEDVDTVTTFMQENEFDFPVALDFTGAVYQQYGGNGLPSSFLIGPTGDIVTMWRPGAITRSMLERDVTPLLGG